MTNSRLVEDNLAVAELIQQLLLEANEVRVPFSLYQQHYPRSPAQIQDEIEAITLDFIKQDFPYPGIWKCSPTGCIRHSQEHLAIGNRGYRNEVRLRGLNASLRRQALFV